VAWYDKEHGRFEYTVRGFDKLVLANDKLKPAVTRAALRIANMVRDRVDKQGKTTKARSCHRSLGAQAGTGLVLMTRDSMARRSGTNSSHTRAVM